MKTKALKEHAKAAKPVKEFEETCKKRITPTGLTEGERGFEQKKECYLTKVIPFFKTLKEHFEGIQKALTTVIKEMKSIFDELEIEVDQNAVNRKCDKIEPKNLLIASDTLIANCLSKEVFYIATNSKVNVSRFSEMHDAHTVVQARCLELETELSKLKDKIQKDDHEVMVKRFYNLEVQNNREVHLDYLKHLKESVATLYEIVEEAKVERPLERSVASACLYTKHSQELLEYVVQIVLCYLDSGCSKHMTGDRSRLRNLIKTFIGTVRFRNDHFIMGKHSCYVRDTDGVELIKGSYDSNLYTISVEHMIESSPICLFSKASKTKSWLWHRHLNHLNFGTINDLARKYLVRGVLVTDINKVTKSKQNRTKPNTKQKA
nr:integrase, catalytic region, zinc finger, CCHC-type, peptidase aspartic, catalytic [Tanacetum cinerariifolium]